MARSAAPPASRRRRRLPAPIRPSPGTCHGPIVAPTGTGPAHAAGGNRRRAEHMADIRVERKGPSIWPWIVGLLVLALLIWAIAEMVDTDEPQVAEVEEVPPAAVPTPEAGAASIPSILADPSAHV